MTGDDVGSGDSGTIVSNTSSTEGLGRVCTTSAWIVSYSTDKYQCWEGKLLTRFNIGLGVNTVPSDSSNRRAVSLAKLALISDFPPPGVVSGDTTGAGVGVLGVTSVLAEDLIVAVATALSTRLSGLCFGAGGETRAVRLADASGGAGGEAGTVHHNSRGRARARSIDLGLNEVGWAGRYAGISDLIEAVVAGSTAATLGEIGVGVGVERRRNFTRRTSEYASNQLIMRSANNSPLGMEVGDLLMWLVMGHSVQSSEYRRWRRHAPGHRD